MSNDALSDTEHLKDFDRMVYKSICELLEELNSLGAAKEDAVATVENVYTGAMKKMASSWLMSS